MRLTKEKRAYMVMGQVVNEAIRCGFPVDDVEIDARDVAAHQHISKRQGQRVLNWMHENGLASKFETVGSNGRPKTAFLLEGDSLQRARVLYNGRKDVRGQS